MRMWRKLRERYVGAFLARIMMWVKDQLLGTITFYTVPQFVLVWVCAESSGVFGIPRVAALHWMMRVLLLWCVQTRVRVREGERERERETSE